MQPINMIISYYWDKKLKKRLDDLEVDIITIIKRYWFDVHIYQTPPLGQDMTQGQFLSGV